MIVTAMIVMKSSHEMSVDSLLIWAAVVWLQSMLLVFYWPLPFSTFIITPANLTGVQYINRKWQSSIWALRFAIWMFSDTWHFYHLLREDQLQSGSKSESNTYLCFKNSYLLRSDLEIGGCLQALCLRIARPLPQLVLKLLRLPLLRQLEFLQETHLIWRHRREPAQANWDLHIEILCEITEYIP